jgi:formate dehydrogenase major subunit
MIRVFMKNHGNHPFGNAKARAIVWNFPDAIPQHREPLYSPRLTWWRSTRRTPTRWRSGACRPVQDRAAEERRGWRRQELPLVLTSSRLVEYEGGDALERMACPAAAGELRRDQSEGRQRSRHQGRRYVWVQSPTKAQIKVKAMVTERVGPGTTFIPFHFADGGRARTCSRSTPKAQRRLRGEAVNTATTYGYDSVTMMQETKTTLCQVAKI